MPDLLSRPVCSGTVILYDRVTGEKVVAQGKHKRRITCGDWNESNKLAFGSEDRLITICTADGEIVDQVSQS